MKRTKYPTQINLIRKIAWSFHYTTGIDYDDLFSEACLAYCEGLKKYDKNKSKLSTYSTIVIKSHMINYVNKIKKDRLQLMEELNMDASYNTEPLVDLLSTSAQLVLKAIQAINEPLAYTKQELLEIVETDMVDSGKSEKTVWCGVRDIKLALNI